MKTKAFIIFRSCVHDLGKKQNISKIFVSFPIIVFNSVELLVIHSIFKIFSLVIVCKNYNYFFLCICWLLIGNMTYYTLHQTWLSSKLIGHSVWQKIVVLIFEIITFPSNFLDLPLILSSLSQMLSFCLKTIKNHYRKSILTRYRFFSPSRKGI